MYPSVPQPRTSIFAAKDSQSLSQLPLTSARTRTSPTGQLPHLSRFRTFELHRQIPCRAWPRSESCSQSDQNGRFSSLWLFGSLRNPSLLSAPHRVFSSSGRVASPVEHRAAAALARSAKTARFIAWSCPPCPISPQANPQSHDTIDTPVHLLDRMPYEHIGVPTPSSLTHAMSASLATHHTLVTAQESLPLP